MKVSELILKLNEINQDTEVVVFDHELSEDCEPALEYEDDKLVIYCGKSLEKR